VNFTCERCGVDVVPGRNGAYQRASGWHGRARGAGGQNHLALIEREQRFLCRPCVDLLRLDHVDVEQLSLFDGGVA
jgi:hypothetical protein